MALDENLHQFGDSPPSCLGWRRQLLIRFEFEPPRFRALSCWPQLDFLLCNYAEWHWMKFCTNLGIPRTVALSGEASYLFVLNLSPLGFGHLPCCPQLDFNVELCRMALDENPH